MGTVHAKATEHYMKNEATYASSKAKYLPGMEHCTVSKKNKKQMNGSSSNVH